MHIKHLIKEAIEKGVPIEDYIKSLDSSHRYYPLIQRKNKYFQAERYLQKRPELAKAKRAKIFVFFFVFVDSYYFNHPFNFKWLNDRMERLKKYVD